MDYISTQEDSLETPEELHEKKKERKSKIGIWIHTF